MSLTGLTGLTDLADNLPIRTVMTDDPMRARMLAAHWLENAKALFELRGMIGYAGSYKGAELTLMAVGYGESAALLYLRDACLLGIRRVVYMGECIARVPGVKLRDLIFAHGGDAALTGCALAASSQLSIPAAVRHVTTNDHLFLDKSGVSGDIVDFASGAVARFAVEQGIAALSVLTVSQNTATGERMEQHERQSRFHDAARITFETLAMDAGITASPK